MKLAMLPPAALPFDEVHDLPFAPAEIGKTTDRLVHPVLQHPVVIIDTTPVKISATANTSTHLRCPRAHLPP